MRLKFPFPQSRAPTRIALALLLLTPLAASLLSLRPTDFDSPGQMLNLLGRLTGVAGLTCLLLSAILIVRVPGFDVLFGGLTKLWQIHHRLGAAAFLLLLAHPLLLSIGAAEVSLDAAVQTLFPPTAGTATWLGWAALLLTMVFLAPSFAFFGEPEYQRWKWVHRLSGLALLLALIHTFMLARSLPPPWDWVVWCSYAVIALAAVAWRLVFSRYFGRLHYRVAGVDRPANNVVELNLLPENHPLKYRPGQFIYLTPCDRRLSNGYKEEHPYTLSSAPGELGLRVAIKDLGDASRAIQSIEPGARVTVEGPYGDFFPQQSGTELWIAGGIGITPFLGRARHLAACRESVDICLIYCVQDEARALFADELASLANELPGFQFTLHYFYREGPLNADFLNSHCVDIGKRTAYLCGPTPLVNLARAQLIAAGTPRDRINTEEFVLL